MAKLQVSSWAQKEWRVTVDWATGETSMGFWDGAGNLLGTVYRYGGRSTSSLIMSLSDPRYESTAFETVWSSTLRDGINSPLKKAITFDLRSYYDFKIDGLYEDSGKKIASGETALDEFSIKGTAGSRGEGKTVSVFVDGELVGTTRVVGGKWAFETTHAYRDGEHQVSAIIDRDGYRTETKKANVVIDTTAPEVSSNVIVHGINGNELDFTAGTISNASEVLISGSVSTEATKVEVYSNGLLQGLATVSGGGWSFQISGLSNGLSKVEVKAYDRVGNVASTEQILKKVDLNDGQTWSSKSGWGVVDVAQAYENLTGQALVATTDPTYVGGQIVDANLVGHVQGVHAAGVRGSGITVAILDTGIRSEYFNTSKISNKSYNFVKNNFDVTDYDGHGTAMASVIGENIQNNSVQGIAPDVELLVLKFAETRFTASDYANRLADAVIYAVDNGADVISMSWTTSILNSPLQWALEYAQSKDVIMVASGGNYSAATQWGNPAIYGSTLDAIVGVGGYGFNAQGHAILSGDNTVQKSESFNGIVGLADRVQALNFYGSVYDTSGTSVAAAITAAQLALLDSVNDHDTYKDVIGSLMAATHQVQNHAVM